MTGGGAREIHSRLSPLSFFIYFEHVLVHRVQGLSGDSGAVKEFVAHGASSAILCRSRRQDQMKSKRTSEKKLPRNIAGFLPRRCGYAVRRRRPQRRFNRGRRLELDSGGEGDLVKVGKDGGGPLRLCEVPPPDTEGSRSSPHRFFSLAAEQRSRRQQEDRVFYLLGKTLLWRVGDGPVSPSPFGSRHPGRRRSCADEFPQLDG